MIDLHSHVLPGIDDGPDTQEESVALLRAVATAGTTEIVATPHVSPDAPTRSSTVTGAVAALQPVLDAAGIGVRLRTGGEVAGTMGAKLDDEELRALHLGGGEWLLTECPLSVGATGFEAVARRLAARGHRILLAHPERSPMMQRDPAKLHALVQEGMLVSITAGSLAGDFGATVRRFTHRLVEEGLVHNVVSDTHDTVRRPPVLAEAVAQADQDLPGLGDLAGWLCHDVPRAILDGGPVPRAPGPPPRRRPRGLLRLRRAARSR